MREEKCESFQKCEGAARFVDTTGDWLNLTPGTVNTPLSCITVSATPHTNTHTHTHTSTHTNTHHMFCFTELMQRWRWQWKRSKSFERRRDFELPIFLAREETITKKSFTLMEALYPACQGMSVFTSGSNNPTPSPSRCLINLPPSSLLAFICQILCSKSMWSSFGKQ